MTIEIECRNCGHGAHNDDCRECGKGYGQVCRVFAPDWEALQEQLQFYAGAVTGIRSQLAEKGATQP